MAICCCLGSGRLRRRPSATPGPAQVALQVCRGAVELDNCVGQSSRRQLANRLQLFEITPRASSSLRTIMTPSAMARSHSDNRASAVVVGAGIAGLSAAFYLAERGFQVTIYEKQKRAGGNLGATISQTRKPTLTEQGDVFEVYPHMFGDWYNNFWEIMDAIGRGKDARDLWRPMTEFKFLARPKTPAEKNSLQFKTLRNNGSWNSLWSNLVSGIIPLPDMFLAGYAALGLMSEDFKDTYELNAVTFNDFVNTRFYGSRYVTQFYQMLILYIWSLEPDESSVYACQRFFQLQFKRPTPTAWVLNSGNAYTDVIEPIVEHLQNKLHVKFCFDAPVVAASLNQEKNSVEQIMVIDNYSENQAFRLVPENRNIASADLFIFAVPPETLSALVQTPIPDRQTPNPQTTAGQSLAAQQPQVVLGSNKFGIITDIFVAAAADSGAAVASAEADLSSEKPFLDQKGVANSECASASPADSTTERPLTDLLQRQAPIRPAIVDAIPELATTKTLSAEPIPVLYLGFKAGATINLLIPKNCYVGLTESKYALTFVEITSEFGAANSQLFASDPPVGTIIALAASDYGELPVLRTPTTRTDRTADSPACDSSEAMVLEAKSKDLLLKEAANYLPFDSDDIAWCFFRTNANHRLFLNDVESARNPVKTIYRRHPNSSPIINNLSFAGDYCSHDVIMSTVEAAVESGIRAGMQLVESQSQAQLHSPSTSSIESTPHVDAQPIKLKQHSTYPRSLMTVSKLMLTPYAIAAKSWSDLNILLDETREAASDPSQIKHELLPQLVTFWPRQASMCLGAYQDALNTMSALAATTVVHSSGMFLSLFTRR